MELCQKQTDETTTISSRENYLDGVQNKIVNQLSKKTDHTFNKQDGNMKNSMNCSAEFKQFTVTSKSPILVNHRKTSAHHKSPTKRTKSVVKIAKAAIDDAKEQGSFYSSVLSKRLRHNDRMEPNHIMLSVIHHHHQLKHSTLNEFAKHFLTNIMLKKNSTKSAVDDKPAAQGFVTKSFRRRSLCEECSILNDVVTTRFETGFVNTITTSANNSEGNSKTCNFGSPKKLPTDSTVGQRCTAFSRYVKDTNGDNNSNKRSAGRYDDPPIGVVGTLPDDRKTKLDDSTGSTEVRSIKREKTPVLILLNNNQVALSSTSSLSTTTTTSISDEYPFPSYFPSSAILGAVDVTANRANLHNRKVDVDDDKKVGFDENAYFVYRADADASAFDVDSALLDMEVELFMTKAKKRKTYDEEIVDRCPEPVAYTLTVGDDKYFLPIVDHYEMSH